LNTSGTPIDVEDWYSILSYKDILTALATLYRQKHGEDAYPYLRITDQTIIKWTLVRTPCQVLAYILCRLLREDPTIGDLQIKERMAVKELHKQEPSIYDTHVFMTKIRRAIATVCESEEIGKNIQVREAIGAIKGGMYRENNSSLLLLSSRLFTDIYTTESARRATIMQLVCDFLCPKDKV